MSYDQIKTNTAAGGCDDCNDALMFISGNNSQRRGGNVTNVH